MQIGIIMNSMTKKGKCFYFLTKNALFEIELNLDIDFTENIDKFVVLQIVRSY